MNDYEVLRNLREAHNITQTELARILDVSYPSYRRYENGERKLPLKVLVGAAKYFNVPVTDFNKELSVTGIGNKGYTIQNTNSSEVLEVSEDEFLMLKSVLEAYRKKR